MPLNGFSMGQMLETILTSRRITDSSSGGFWIRIF
jgi:hypothetical protein